MSSLGDLVRTRLIPAVLTAGGVALVTAGLITWTDPAVAGVPSPSPAIVTPAPTASPTASPGVTAEPTESPTPAPSPSPTIPADRVATRVAVPALKIDMPVIKQPGGYPWCNVAMYIQQLGQPGEGKATYLYAHAREGMFLPLLEQSRIKGGDAMVGMLVQVWTSDEQLFLYEITEVRPHQRDLDDAIDADHEQLWLQTSEGPRGTPGKLQVVAELLSSGPVADPADAHPKAKPVDCS